MSQEFQIRDTLFGDMPLSQWPGPSSAPQDEPWRSFATARNQIESGDETAAIETLKSIVLMEDLESRHLLQAWHFLRNLGYMPDPVEGKRVYGVVVEVALNDGLDIVAAYENRSARYFNYTGAAVIWEQPDDSLNENIDALLEAGELVAEQIGPWEDTRPPAPHEGQARISMLTPSGIHFGEAPLTTLSNDPLGGRVISAAILLMQALIAKTQEVKG